MSRNARIQPSSMDVVLDEVRALYHINGVVHDGPDLAPDLDLLQGHHHRPPGGLSSLSLGKQMPKLHMANQTWSASCCCEQACLLLHYYILY